MQYLINIQPLIIIIIFHTIFNIISDTYPNKLKHLKSITDIILQNILYSVLWILPILWYVNIKETVLFIGITLITQTIINILFLKILQRVNNNTNNNRNNDDIISLNNNINIIQLIITFTYISQIL